MTRDEILARRLFGLKNSKGETILEAFGPGRSDDLVSESLRFLTWHLTCGDPDPAGLFGGTFGYGTDFENNVFLMHRYCWCEREDCLWCSGGCEDGYPHQPHADNCYQSRLRRLRREQGVWDKNFGFWSVPRENEPVYDSAKKALCEELGSDYEFGNEVHCTCGADKKAKRLYDGCQCDWHLGKGRYRFGPATQTPNFWHKPTNLQIRWYKYIGRDMEFNRDSITVADWATILRPCLKSTDSLPLEKAWEEYAEASSRAASREQAAMKAAVESAFVEPPEETP